MSNFSVMFKESKNNEIEIYVSAYAVNGFGY